jgi:glutamyl-Q tRNA(Asp) synthetase
MVISKDCPSILPATYRGRFAPSPTGPLHFGSLVAALGSCLDARAVGGQWLVRIEDLDPPREVPGAADDILRTLEAFGFEWDGEVVYQSRRIERYRAALDKLSELQLAYPCACTRKEIADSSIRGIDGPVYRGTCRSGLPNGKQPRAWRLKVGDADICFTDRVFGPLCQNLEREVGDFVLLRADGYFAYQLAVVVDDAAQGVSDIVRGADLLDSTPRQIQIINSLGLAQMRYAHLPLVCNADGEKLSKQTKAPALDLGNARAELWLALSFLEQSPPAMLKTAEVKDIWRWAVENWRLPTRAPGSGVSVA